MIRRNILIFHSGGLGDFVLSWPLGMALGRLYPQSRIIYVTHSSKGKLADRALRLDWRDAENSWPALYAESPQLDPKTQQLLAETHAIFSFIAAENDVFWKNAAAFDTQAGALALRTIPPDAFKRHASEFLLEQLAPAPAIRDGVRQILAWIAKNGLGHRPAADTGQIILQPGAGAREKCWPVDRFAKLADRLNEKGRRPKFVLGEVELERLTSADIHRLESAAPVLKPATYSDLYDLLLKSAAFLGNDSGPSHLAAICGAPTLTLFGPTDPSIWRPLGPRTAIIHQNLAILEAEEVDLALENLLKAL